MVKHIRHNAKETHQREACGLRYERNTIAESCEAWCKQHQNCNLEIISHAIKEHEHENAQNR